MRPLPLFGTPTARYGTPAPADAGLPADFLNAIKDRFLKSELAAVVPGGIFLEVTGRGKALPYVVVTETGANTKLVTSSSVIHDTRVRFRVYAGDTDATGKLGDKLENLFTDATLDFQNGWSTRWVRGDRRHMLDRSLSAAGAEVWYLQIEYLTRVKR